MDGGSEESIKYYFVRWVTAFEAVSLRSRFAVVAM